MTLLTTVLSWIYFSTYRTTILSPPPLTCPRQRSHVSNIESSATWVSILSGIESAPVFSCDTLCLFFRFATVKSRRQRFSEDQNRQIKADSCRSPSAVRLGSQPWKKVCSGHAHSGVSPVHLRVSEERLQGHLKESSVPGSHERMLRGSTLVLR